MGVLDKLMFWRTKTVEFETDIEGCFTLPGAEIGSKTLTNSAADAKGAACETPMADAVEATDMSDVSDALPDESNR